MSSNEEDPLNVAELIRQGREIQKKWRKPSFDEPKGFSAKPWQKIMDERKYTSHGRWEV